jgi:hypothetical protein
MVLLPKGISGFAWYYRFNIGAMQVRVNLQQYLFQRHNLQPDPGPIAADRFDPDQCLVKFRNSGCKAVKLCFAF